MTISEVEDRILALVNKHRSEPVKSALSLHLTYLEGAYRYAVVRGEEKSTDKPPLAATKIAISMGLDKSTFGRCLQELDALYGCKDAWHQTILRDFPALKRIALGIMSGGIPQPTELVVACPPSVATSFVPKVLKEVWAGGGYPEEFQRVRLEVRQTHDNERDLRELAAGSIRMKLVESYAVEPESLKAMGLTAERLFTSMPLGLIYPLSNRPAAAAFAGHTGAPDWKALSGETFLLTHSYRIADAIAELLPEPTAGGGRVYLTTLNNVHGCLVTEGMNAIGIGVDPNLPDAFGHYSFRKLSDDKPHRFLRSNAVVSYSVIYPTVMPETAQSDSKRTRRVPTDPLEAAQNSLLQAMRTAAKRYTHPFQS